MLHTPVCDLLGIEFPIIQAGMGPFTSAELVAAVSNAGALGSLGGALTAIAVGHVAPDLAYWTASGEFVFVALLGGSGSVFAPFIGATVFELVRNYAVKVSPYTWQLLLGTVLLVIILFAPGGLWSMLERAAARRRAAAEPPKEGRWALSWKR